MQYVTQIALGQKCRDTRLDIGGYAKRVLFNENGCVNVQLESVKDGKRETDWFDEQRLVAINEAGDHLQAAPVTQTHESDIILGRKYEDIQTGINGWAATIMFSENMATVVELRNTGVDKDGITVLKYQSIDDFLLKDVETKVVAERVTAKPSPVSRESTDRPY